MTTWMWLACALAAEAGGDAENKDAWKVEEAHGPVHSVHIDTEEGTWIDVSVYGDTVVFDLLGDLWTLPLAGGEAARLTEGPAWDGQPAFSPDGSKIAFVSDRGGNENLWVMNADGSDPKPLTTEEIARVTDPTWVPDGQWIVGRRRTVDTRSIGVTELWQWSVDGGKGIPLTKLDEHPHAGEPTLDERYLYFSSRYGRFEYNHDPVSGLWRIERMDRRDGTIRTVVHGPGSASRPLLTPDGDGLVFISRDRTRTLLEHVDLATGKRRVLGDWLAPDNLEGFALHGTYPRMDWTEAGDLVLWADGRLWRVDVSSGVRVEVPFHVEGDWQLHDVQRPRIDIADDRLAKVLRWPSRSARGAVAFSALGRLHVRTPDGTVSRIGAGTGYAPAWSANGEDLLYTSWSDVDGGALHLVPGRGKPEVLPVKGQLVNPSFGPDGRVIVLRGGGGGTNPDLGAEPWFEVVLLTRDKSKRGWSAHVVTTIGNPGSNSRAPRPRLHDERIWWMETRYEEPRQPGTAWLVSVALDGTDKRDHAKLGGATEAVISPDFGHIAIRRGHQLHVAKLALVGKPVDLTADQVPAAQVTKIVGDWLGWSADGAEVTWIHGNSFKSLPVASLFEKKPEKDDEEKDEGADPLAEPVGTKSLVLEVPYARARPTGVVALTNARVITMEGDEVLEDTTVVIRGDRIASVGGEIPAGARVIDCTGKTVIPGLIDVHAHLHYSSGDVLPEQEWRYLTNLDFGVTTVQDPSASTDLVFTQAEMVEAGLMAGPRVFSTGFVLYGALANDGADTPTLDAARAHVRRLKAVGAHSVKVYQQSQRTRRQWYLKACAEEGVLCVPEGGGDLWMNLGMVADGYHAIEHSLPVSPLRDDVLQLWAGSPTEGSLGTAYSQTLLVAYGGIGGENWFLQHRNPVDDERLLRHFPKRLLDAYAWRPTVMAQDGDWRHQSVARDGAALQDRGVLTTLGAHGQLQGLGVHWELWALAGPGAMEPHEALRAATLGGAQYMGLDHELGSIREGKLADLVILSADPLTDVTNTTAIAYVIKNGEVRE